MCGVPDGFEAERMREALKLGETWLRLDCSFDRWSTLELGKNVTVAIASAPKPNYNPTLEWIEHFILLAYLLALENKVIFSL